MGLTFTLIIGMMLYFLGIRLLAEVKSEVLFFAFIIAGWMPTVLIAFQVATYLGLDTGSSRAERECVQERFQVRCN